MRGRGQVRDMNGIIILIQPMNTYRVVINSRDERNGARMNSREISFLFLSFFHMIDFTGCNLENIYVEHVVCIEVGQANEAISVPRSLLPLSSVLIL